jgi:hypothetical protein
MLKGFYNMPKFGQTEEHQKAKPKISPARDNYILLVVSGMGVGALFPFFLSDPIFIIALLILFAVLWSQRGASAFLKALSMFVLGVSLGFALTWFLFVYLVNA